MKILGLSEGFHDAGATLVEDGKIVSATHSERFSRIKNDKHLHPSQIVGADVVAYYEDIFKKNTRNLFSGQSFKKAEVDYDISFDHHESHAAAGFYTSPFDECNVLVIDSIGEWNTISVWYCYMQGDTPIMKKRKTWNYPFSVGLFYSAITQRVGLKPNEDEYITMGMAGYGEPIYDMEDLLFTNCHQGLGKVFPNAKDTDIAASAQKTIEDFILNLIQEYCPHRNLVFMGGVALNCVLNSKIQKRFHNKMWIMPNPGDCGSSLGAAALAYGKKLEWVDPYLGTNIDRLVNPKEVVDHLLSNSYCGIANGRAEFGPRALGNRSLIADPRKDIKDTVNKIKQRQLFRPFAPAILEEFKDEYFDGPMNEYMQFVAEAKHDYNSVTHVDGTARVQVVKKDCTSILRPILEEWYDQTNCPMLLNTSLNIKGQPMVDNEKDARDFEEKYNVKVF